MRHLSAPFIMQVSTFMQVSAFKGSPDEHDAGH